MSVAQTKYRLELNHLVLLCAASPIPLPFRTLYHSCWAGDTEMTNFTGVSFQLPCWPDLLAERATKIGCFRHF